MAYSSLPDKVNNDGSEFLFLADSLPQIVWSADSSGRIRYLNKHWTNYTGLPVNTSEKRRLLVLHHEDLKRIIDAWQDSIIRKKPCEIEIRLKNKAGSYQWHLVRAIPMHGENGEVEKWLGTSTDIQDQKIRNYELNRKNKELLKINTDLDNFIYTASHDLKAPIANLEALFFELHRSLKKYYTKDEEAMAEMVRKSIDKFQRTIMDLTEVARIQKELQESKEKIFFKEVLEEVVTGISQNLKESGAHITSVIKVNEFFFSRRNLRSILYNLLSNAVKYRDRNKRSRVWIRTFSKGKYNIISIKDNGLGFNMNKKEKIFSMFKRLHSHIEGSGVGLYIVKRNVENAGGHIEVISEEGTGSEFIVYLPKNMAQNVLAFNGPQL